MKKRKAKIKNTFVAKSEKSAGALARNIIAGQKKMFSRGGG